MVNVVRDQEGSDRLLKVFLIFFLIRNKHLLSPSTNQPAEAMMADMEIEHESTEEIVTEEQHWLELVQSPLDFNIPVATFLFLQQIGIIDSTISTIRPSLLSLESTVTSVPLINQQDVVSLLSILPSNLLPELPFRLPASPKPNATTRRSVLDTLARLSLEPSLTLPIMRHFRPLACHFWGRWLEMLRIDLTTGEFPPRDQQSVEEGIAVQKVMRAMIKLQSVFENVYPFVQLFFSPLVSTHEDRISVMKRLTIMII
jgi:hypothetical protein